MPWEHHNLISEHSFVAFLNWHNLHHSAISWHFTDGLYPGCIIRIYTVYILSYSKAFCMVPTEAKQSKNLPYCPGEHWDPSYSLYFSTLLGELLIINIHFVFISTSDLFSLFLLGLFACIQCPLAVYAFLLGLQCTLNYSSLMTPLCQLDAASDVFCLHQLVERVSIYKEVHRQEHLPCEQVTIQFLYSNTETFLETLYG